jgi:hypothetical protein
VDDLRIDPASFFRSLLRDRFTISQLCEAIDRSFGEWFQRERAHAWKMDEYIRHHLAKRTHEAIRNVARGRAEGSHTTIGDLTEFLRAVQMPCEALVRFAGSPAPFANWKPGSIVAVCIARRAAKNEEGQGREAGWSRFVHGSRDVLALNDLVQILQRKLHLEFALQIEPVDPALGSKDADETARHAEELLKKLLANDRVGAVVSLGSGPHNAVSNLLANRLTDGWPGKTIAGDIGEFPAAFRWTTDMRRKLDVLDEQHASWLRDERHDAPTAEAGVWFRTKGGIQFAPRVTDRLIAGGERGRLDDCGLLAIDVRRRPVLVLAAGHGGNGTRACVQALGRTAVIEDYLCCAGPDDQAFFSAEGRFVQAVTVNRKKVTEEPVDDTTIEDWHFLIPPELGTAR